jgi:3-oxoacyl-(acyl-carrier-protein) synthase
MPAWRWGARSAAPRRKTNNICGFTASSICGSSLHDPTIDEQRGGVAPYYVLRADGPALSFGTACAAGTHAIGEAAEIVRAGRAEIMLAGGADAPIAYGVMKAWEAMRVMAPQPATVPRARAAVQPRSSGAGGGRGRRHRDPRRVGARPRPRGVILAELAGYGATADAAHLTQPGVHAPARAMLQALSQASLSPGDVDYINAHGTATRLNDATETAVIKQVFGASRHAWRSARRSRCTGTPWAHRARWS